MAVDSIAKLAVVITGDTGPLAREMNKATVSLKRWTQDAESTNTAALKMSQGLSAARGNFGAIVSIAQHGGLATGLAAASVAAGMLAMKMAAVSDAQRVAAGANKSDTWAGQWERASKAASSIAATLGRPIADVLANEARFIADILGMIARSIMPETLRQEQAQIAALERQKQLLESQATTRKQILQGMNKFESSRFMELENERIRILAGGEKAGEGKTRLTKDDAARVKGIREEQIALQMQKARREADAAASNEANRAFDEMQQRAKSIADSFRTPRQEMLGALAELDSLFAAGAMNAMQYDRAVLGTIEKFDKVNRKALIPLGASPGVGAAEMHTMAGFSAAQSGKRELERMEKIAAEQLRVEREKKELQKETNEILRTLKPSGIQLSRSGIT